MMDSLASSHTAHSSVARRLLVMVVVLELLLCSIMEVAGASASEIDQGKGSVATDSLARFRIRGVHSEPNDGVLQRSGSVPAAPDRISPPSIGIRIGMSGVEGKRRILGDISPPGMWPTPDGQDPAPAQEEFRLRSLLTGGHSPPPMGPWFVVMHSSQDGEDAFLRQGLSADTAYPLLPWALVINQLRELGTMLNISSFSFPIRLPQGYKSWLKNTVERIVRGQRRVVAPAAVSDGTISLETVPNEMGSAGQFGNNPDNLLETNLAKRQTFTGRILLDGDTNAAHETRTESGDDGRELSESEQQTSVEDFKMPRRSLLQRDISPPGMWPDSDDDEDQLSEHARERNLVEGLKIPSRSLLQGDISPPGMWSDSDDDENSLSEFMLLRRRSLLNKFPRRSLLQRDISPPGMWPDSDDSENRLSKAMLLRRRSLLSKFPRRSLLQGDISPPGMWPDSDDSESQLSESMPLRRRSLLTKFPRRSLLQGDISPPGMGPDSDDSESQLSESMPLRRRSLLNQFPRRSLLQGDISPPGMWSDSDDDEIQL